MKGYVGYICDTETTGMDSEVHEIIEISLSRIVLDNSSSYKEDDQKTWLLKATKPQSISDEALSINGHKKEDILCHSKYGKENYKNPVDVINEIELWMMDDNVSSMDRVFIGQNPMFDLGFLKKLWSKYKNDFPFSIENGNRIIDTKQIIVLYDLCTGKRRQYYGLGQLVKSCGIKKDKAHTADGDVRMTRDLVLYLINMIKPIVSSNFINCYNE